MVATVEANTQEEEEDDWSCQEGNSQQTLLPCRGLHSVVGVGKPVRVWRHQSPWGQTKEQRAR